MIPLVGRATMRGIIFGIKINRKQILIFFSKNRMDRMSETGGVNSNQLEIIQYIVNQGIRFRSNYIRQNNWYTL